MIRWVQSSVGDGRHTFCIESGLHVDPGILAESVSNDARFVTVKKWRYGDEAPWSTDYGKRSLNGVRNKV